MIVKLSKAHPCVYSFQLNHPWLRQTCNDSSLSRFWLCSEHTRTFDDQKRAVALLLFTWVKNGAMTVESME